MIHFLEILSRLFDLVCFSVVAKFFIFALEFTFVPDVMTTLFQKLMAKRWNWGRSEWPWPFQNLIRSSLILCRNSLKAVIHITFTRIGCKQKLKQNAPGHGCCQLMKRHGKTIGHVASTFAKAHLNFLTRLVWKQHKSCKQFKSRSGVCQCSSQNRPFQMPSCISTPFVWIFVIWSNSTTKANFKFQYNIDFSILEDRYFKNEPCSVFKYTMCVILFLRIFSFTVNANCLQLKGCWVMAESLHATRMLRKQHGAFRVLSPRRELVNVPYCSA